MTTLTDDELLLWLAGFGLGDGRHAEVCRQFSARFRELLAQQEWQPIETAPKDESRILIFSDDGVDIGHWSLLLRWERDSTAEYDNDDAAITNPKKWRPLPAPPKDT